MASTPCSSPPFRVGGQRDTVNNPTTWFGPLSHISRMQGPQGTAVAASGASDTCWPLPSLPDWQMAAPLDENDKWLSAIRKDFLLTSDPWPWLLTPLRGRYPLSPSLLSLFLQACGVVSRPSTGAGCRSGLSDLESSFCSSEGGIYRGERWRARERMRRWRVCCSATVREKRETGFVLFHH